MKLQHIRRGAQEKRISNSNTPSSFQPMSCQHLNTSALHIKLPSSSPSSSSSSSSSPVTGMAPTCCACCLGTLFSLGFSALFLWLSLRTHPPKCSLQSLSLLTQNDTLVFQLSLKNDNMDKGVKYGAVLVTFALFVDNTTTRPLTNATLLPFYQGRAKTSRKWGSAVAPHLARLNRTAAVKNGNVFLRVEFATRVKYKVWLAFYIKRHRLVGGANVEVNASSGEKVEPEAIRLGDVLPRLGSGAAVVRSWYVAVVGVFVTGFFVT